MKRRAFTGAALGLAGGMVVSGRAGVSGWMTEAVAQVQKLLAEDCVLAWLYQPHWVSVARTSLAGLWDDMPMLVNDLRSMRWVS